MTSRTMRYVGNRSPLSRRTALVRTDGCEAGRCLAQFDHAPADLQHLMFDWHDFALSDFEECLPDDPCDEMMPPRVGGLDDGVPNCTDSSKRGFDPK